MRRLSHFILVIFTLLIIFDCTSQNRGEALPVSERIIQKWKKMWRTKDLNMIDDIYLDEAIFEDVPDLATYKGKEKIRKFMGELFIYSPDTNVEINATFLGKDWAVVEWIWSGTQTGDIEGVIEATGNKFSIR